MSQTQYHQYSEEAFVSELIKAGRAEIVHTSVLGQPVESESPESLSNKVHRVLASGKIAFVEIANKRVYFVLPEKGT